MKAVKDSAIPMTPPPPNSMDISIAQGAVEMTEAPGAALNVQALNMFPVGETGALKADLESSDMGHVPGIIAEI